MNQALLRYEWEMIPWRKLEKTVFKLQKRIYRASLNGENKLVHRLQRLLLKSHSAKLLAIRKVTQDNRGKKTPGIDGKVAIEPKDRLKLAQELNISKKPQPTRRVWIPKPGKQEKRQVRWLLSLNGKPNSRKILMALDQEEAVMMQLKQSSKLFAGKEPMF